MKKLVSLLLVFVMLFALLPQLTPTAEAATSGNCGKNVKWSYNTQTGVMTLSGSGPMTDYTKTDDQPWKDFAHDITKLIIKEGVTSVGSSAFEDCWRITSIQFPKSMKQFGSKAFSACFRLKSVTIPTGVTKIGPRAFQYCYDLASVTLHDKVTEIQEYAFADTDALEKLTLPKSLKVIGKDAFYSAGIKSITIPASVTTVGTYAFSYNRNLVSINFLGSGTQLADSVFSGCTNLTTVKLPAGLKVLPEYSFYDCDALKTLPIPAGMTTIGPYAFEYCDGLEELTIPEGITTIERYAFNNCDHIWKINFPKSLKTLGDGVFANCEFLTGVILPKTLTSAGYGVFNNCPNFQGGSVLNAKLDIEGVNYNDSFFSSPESATVAGYANSTAETLAIKNKYAFEDLKKHTHKYTTVTLTGDCLHAGHKVQVCKCGQIQKETTLAPQGHFYKNGKCIRCKADRPDTFTDVKKNAFYADAVAWAVERNITKGTSATTFGPEEKCTRAQVVTFLWRAKGCPEPKSTKNPFKDVKAKDYYYKAVLWAVEKGITTGVSKTSFGPNQACTRGQVVTFIWRAQKQPSPGSYKNPFTDVSKKMFCYDAVRWAVRTGVTSGLTKTTFGPNQTCTRGQVVTFLCRALGK